MSVLPEADQDFSAVLADSCGVDR